MYSFLYDKPKGGLSEVLSCYPQIQQTKLESSKPGFEIENRYFLMYQTSSPNKDKTEILAERKWRKWVDDTLVHTLSPNVYRTPAEALQVMKSVATMFSFIFIFCKPLYSVYSPISKQQDTSSWGGG